MVRYSPFHWQRGGGPSMQPSYVTWRMGLSCMQQCKIPRKYRLDEKKKKKLEQTKSKITGKYHIIL